MHFLQIFLQITLTCVFGVYSCPHAFDWEKTPPEERATDADIVVVGYVTKSYKDLADEHSTYAVDFKIIRSLKGEDKIATLPATNQTNEGIYRITNFGSMLMCFADLDEEHVYMLFLKIVDNHLSGLYTDLFGAAEIWTMAMEDKVIHTNTGFDVWSEWSACSESCGQNGTQIRVRQCTRTSPELCTGHNSHKRKCNRIGCAGVRNIVELADFESMEKGVISLNVSGTSVYDLTPNFYGQISAPRIFSPLWPQKFSIMGRIRPRKTRYPREAQYLFSLSDSAGRIYLGLKAYPSPTIEVMHSTGHMTSVSIPLPSIPNINDGHWHQFGFGISGTNVTMYYNCLQRNTERLPAEPFIPNVYKSTMIIGSKMFAMDRGSDERYEGALSQLVLTSNPSDVENQCQPQTWGETFNQKQDTSPRQSARGLGADAVNYLDHWEWSTWGECSVSCGFGVKARRPFCLDEKINEADCIPYYVPRTHERQCYGGRCPVCECNNNGRCISDGVCQCEPGWTGDNCQTAICENGCTNGQCTAPGVCKCDAGWSGLKCDRPMCFPLCRNGGVCIGHNQCECPPGYGGRFCMEHNKPEKIAGCTRQCQNGGSCVDGNKCECTEGWRGSRCHKPAPVCKDGCLNGGKCRAGNVCKCKKGFSGPRCESDSCGNCRNGGVCDRRSKQCTCPDGYTGQICQYKVVDSLCSKNPCQNVGKCIAYDKCFCPKGWFGLRCEYRKCKKYKIKLEYEDKTVQKTNYKLIPCDTSSHGRCRVPDGVTYEVKPILKTIPDYTRCDDTDDLISSL